MGEIASQITRITIVYSTVYSDADQRKHQSSASLVFVRGIHPGPVISPHKWPVTRKMFPFDERCVSASICATGAGLNQVCRLYLFLVGNNVRHGQYNVGNDSTYYTTGTCHRGSRSSIIQLYHSIKYDRRTQDPGFWSWIPVAEMSLNDAYGTYPRAPLVTDITWQPQIYWTESPPS